MPSYVATTKIKAGVDGETRMFEPGDVVTGLPKEQMKALWEAGALQEASADQEAAVAENGSDAGEPKAGDSGAAPDADLSTPPAGGTSGA